MKTSLIYLLAAATLTTSTPVQPPGTPNRRGLGSTIQNAASDVGSGVQDAANDVGSNIQNAASGAQNAAASAMPSLKAAVGGAEGILSDLLANVPADIISSPKPLKNSAVWQEAIAFDAKSKVPFAAENKIFYNVIAYLQSVENGSSNSSASADSASSSQLVAKGLQYIHAYPAEFDKAQADAGAVVEISPTPQQTIASFGASGAWWPNYLKDFPPAQQKNLSSLLFSKDGLQLSGYRYNMGASGDKDATTVSTPGRGVESFLKTNGSYDFTRDGPGVYYLQAAQDAGVESITFFVNAIPAALTTPTTPCGSALTAAQIPGFITYILTVLEHLATAGIKITYVSPMNEPDNSFSSCTQEGMTVPATLRASVFAALRTALTASTVPSVPLIKIMGDETSQVVSQSLSENPLWLPTALADKSIDAIAAHMYDFPDDASLLHYRRTLIAAAAPNAPPPIKMTEISSYVSAAGMYAPWGWTGPKVMGAEYDPGINSALDMGRMIWQWLALVNAESWDWWTAVSNMMPCSPSTTPGCASTYAAGGEGEQGAGAFNDGLVYVDPQYATTGDFNFYLTKRYWVFRHFTRFLRPGAVRYDVPNEVLPYGTVAVAGKNTDGGWTTTFINRNATSQAIVMKLPGGGGGAKVTGGVQTTDTADWENIPLPVVKADGTFAMTLPAKGVLSIQFSVADVAAAKMRRVRRRDIGGYEYENGDGVLGDAQGYEEFL